MNISISNVIINYFLTHSERGILSKEELTEITKNIMEKFDVKIDDYSKEGIQLTVDLCSDFLSIENDNIIQKGILNYLDDLEPVYEWFKFNKWKREQEYYQFLIDLK